MNARLVSLRHKLARITLRYQTEKANTSLPVLIYNQHAPTPSTARLASRITKSTRSVSRHLRLSPPRHKEETVPPFTPVAPMDATDDLVERIDEHASVQQKLRGGKKGGSTGADAGAGGAQKKAKDISRALSRLLRHQATNAGIALDREGYAPLDKVLQYGPIRSLKATLQDIVAVTADNEKQRFSMKPADPDAAAAAATTASDPVHWLIRANQGHSIPLASEALLTPLTRDTAPAVAVHGTYLALWPRIVASGGLRRMGRNHVHCAMGVPGGGGGGGDGAAAATAVVVSGMRGDVELLVYVDVRRSLEDGSGMRWWLSENGVVLTEGLGVEGLVPLRYFKEVVGRKGDVGTLWKDGEKVADLPEGLKARPPPGKGGAREGPGGGQGRRGGRGGRGGGQGRGEAVVGM